MKPLKPGDYVRHDVKKNGIILYSHAARVEQPVDKDGTILLSCAGVTFRTDETNATTPMSVRPRYIQYAKVWPNTRINPFPIDMLRYDFCSPFNFTLDTQNNPVKEYPEDSLIVVRYTVRSSPDFTTARWNSFLWCCDVVKVIPIPARS